MVDPITSPNRIAHIADGAAVIDRSWAEDFAREWAADWRAKNLDALLKHYAPNVVFRSPPPDLHCYPD